MNRIECLIKIESILNEKGFKLVSFITRDGVIDVTYKDDEEGTGKLYVAYRFMTDKILYNLISREV